MFTLDPSELPYWPPQWRIYLIHAPEVGRFKIGITNALPESRMAAIQTCSPVDLVLIGSCPGFHSWERALHRKFDSSRVRGEWFEDSVLAEALEIVEDLQARLEEEAVWKQNDC